MAIGRSRVFEFDLLPSTLVGLVSASSSTSTASLSLSKSLVASPSAASATTGALLSKIFSLTAQADAASSTTAASLQTLTVRELVASISAASQTSAPPLGIIRTLQALAGAVSQTPQVQAEFILQLVAPTDDNPSVERPVTFQWGSLPGASIYNLLVAEDALFQNVVLNHWTTQRSYELTGLGQSTEYHWKVVAAN